MILLLIIIILLKWMNNYMIEALWIVEGYDNVSVMLYWNCPYVRKKLIKFLLLIFLWVLF